MNKSISIITAILTINLLYNHQLFAQVATDSAVKSIRTAIETKIQDQSVKKLGMVGQILERTGGNIKLMVDDKDWTIKTTDQTTYEKIPGKSKLKLEDLAIQDFVIVKGLPQETKQTLEAQLIQTIPTPEFPERALYQGTIKTIDKQGFTLTTQDKEIAVKLGTTSDIINQSSPSATIKSTSLTAKQQVSVAGTVTNSKTGAVTASVVLVDL